MEANMEVNADLFYMMRREIAAMIRVKLRRNTAQMPAWITLSPYRLMERQSGIHGAWVIKAHHIADNGPTVIIYDGGQPRTSRQSLLIEKDDFEEGVIGLPECIGLCGFTPVQHVKSLFVGFAAFMSQCQERRGYRLHTAIDRTVAGTRPPLLCSDFERVPIDESHGRGWLLQG